MAKRILCIFKLLLLLGWAGFVSADNLNPGSLTLIEKTDSKFDVVFKLPVTNNKASNITIQFSDNVQTVGSVHRIIYSDSFVQKWEINYDKDQGPMMITAVSPQKNVIDILVRVRNLQDDNMITGLIDFNNPTFVISDFTEGNSVVPTYVVYGVEHILLGFDHLLFVLCLVFISGTLKRILLTVTGFTLSHSITLFLASTGVFTISVPPMEAVIALSIVFLAWEIAKDNRSNLSYQYPILVATIFGLLHGFGFASVLSQIGLPQEEKLLALISFNVGVEIGQILFVGALTVLFLLAKKLVHSLSLSSLRTVTSYFCGTISMVWLIERVSAF